MWPSSLFLAAITLPTNYKRVEWWDERGGAMPKPDVQYPTFERVAGFICTSGRCSAPIRSGENLVVPNRKMMRAVPLIFAMIWLSFISRNRCSK
jgi:hypothetical protein